MAQRKRYTKPFKEEALRLVSQEEVGLAQVAKNLGLAPTNSSRTRCDRPPVRANFARLRRRLP